MAQDIQKPVGGVKAIQNDAGGGVIRSEPVIGIVKDNIDPIRSGRIRVYIQDNNGFDPNDSKNWVTVRQLSTFYGKTDGSASANGYGAYGSNPISYGEWHSPPDIGTRVVCIFVNGDMNYGYYIGCVLEPESLTMVPAIGSVSSKVTMNSGEATALAGATQLPVTNLNTNNNGLSDNNQFLDAPKPVHSYLASVLAQQGLIRDTVRGTITSGAQRESPSRVGWGVSTPGRPIYEGGYTDETITDAATSAGANGTTIISRRPGHTFVMDDGDLLGKDQLIRLRTALGHQILMSDDGQCLFIIHANGQSWIELGKEGTIDMFSTNSVNIRTQGDLNLHADNNVNIHAEKNLNIKAKENININSDKETNLRSGADFKQQVLGNYTTKVDGGMSMGAAGEGSYAAAGTMYINGSVVNLNTGQTGLAPLEVTPIPLIAQTDTLFDSEKGFAPSPGKLQTIVTRAPAHQPWTMANKGVDVKVNLDSSAALPEEPSDAVDDTNSTVPSVPDNPVTVATSATVPDVGEASSTLDAGTTAAMVGAVAVNANATVPQAVATGTSITDGVAKIGQLAQTPEQMVLGGSLKPGSEKLINGLIANGASVTGAMPTTVFAGQSGTNTIEQFVNNTTAQVQTQVANFTKSQSQLTAAGIMTGKESPGAVAGIVLSGAQNGVAQTANFIKTATLVGGQAASVVQQLGAQADGIAQSISSGNFAGNLSKSASGGLSGIAAALGSALDNVKGVVASAFDSIVGAYKSFKPGVPQDLKSIAQGSSDTSSVITDSVKDVAGAAKSLATSVTGLQGIPGGDKVIASVVNNAPGAMSNIPGAADLSKVVAATSTSVMNNIPQSMTGAASQAGSLLSGSIPDLSKNLPSMSLGSLATTASSLLPKELAAELNSAINALGAIGPTQVKLPTVAENTTDRTGFNSQVKSIIGNPKVPPPFYGSQAEFDSYVEREEAKLAENRIKLKDRQRRFDEQLAVAKSVKEDWYSAVQSLPTGDPQIEALKKKYETEYLKALKIAEENIQA